MSERASNHKKMPRRAAVPCPRLPASFQSNSHEKSDNYSYASIEFRPVVITDEGAVTAPVDRMPGTIEIDDGISNDLNSNNEDYHWDDEIQAYNAFDVEPYAEMKPDQRHGELRLQGRCETEEQNLPVIPSPFRSLPAVPPSSDEAAYDDQSPVYEDPVNLEHTPDDVSQLYAVVDFSKKKKNRSQKTAVKEEKPSHEKQIDVAPVSNDAESAHRKDHKATISDNGHSKVGKSKFFVAIPDKRAGAPPPVPRPYAVQRKKSAPALLVHNLPPLPPRTREALNFNGKNCHSSEDISDPYASISESSVKKPVRGHRRNLSGDLHYTRPHPAEPVTDSGDYSTINFSEKRSFKKQHRRMKSHETISTVFSPSPTGSNTDLTSIENEAKSPHSGQSSVESSSGDSPGLSKESQDSGENSYEDMSELMRKAEALISDELPEGWQEVRDGSEVYYWHIWTGTIQYERPILSATPSSQSVSPSFSDTNSSLSPSVSEAHEKGLQSKSPDAPPESPHEKPKQAISFPVHSMGWLDVEEDKMSSSVLAETVNECVSSLAEQRKDLWGISETWGEGKDIKLILEGESLKLVEPKSKTLLLVQPIAKMRVWGVGKEDQRDFAYIARDAKTNKHKCHMFRCHGNVSGRSIANALHTICNRVLEEKRRAKERSTKAQKAASDLLNAPLSSSARGNSAFNEKPYYEQKKCFSAKYIGWSEVPKSSGIDTLNKAVNKLTSAREPSEWQTVLVEITTSEIKTIDCSNQDVLMEDRVRFISFLGVAKDERMCGYIVAVGMEKFVCHVFCCIPHAGTLTRAIEEACKLRYEKFMYRGSEESSSQESETKTAFPLQQRTSVKEKGSALKSSVQGLFSKLQKKDSKKKDESSQPNQVPKSPPLQAGTNEYLIKYFGCVHVELGTGTETIQSSVDELSGGAMMIGYLEVTTDGLVLCDSQRTALSRRVIDLDTVSYCGITSDQKHFGVIVSQGRGKYACHVCQEYKTPVVKIVDAIHAML